MTAKVTDRDMLTRTLDLLEGMCCDYKFCPGPDAKPVPMASCARATAAYELRQYLRRHGGWCREHRQKLNQCHATRPNEYGWSPDHTAVNIVCHCRPVNRTPAAEGGTE